MDESDAYFRRMTTLAEQQRLPMWRVRAYALLASNDLLRDAALDRVVQARDEAMRIGAVAWGHSLEASLALYHVLRGEYAEAEELLDRCLPAADRLGLVEVARYATVARATLAAHRGRHRDMDHALDDFRRRGGEQSDHQPIALGLCRAVCALLDEDVDAAHAALAREAEHGHHNPSVYTMTGRYGLSVLLGAMRGDLDLAACEVALEEPPSHLRWNRQFALLGHAVLLGRTGRHAEAEKAFAAAQDAAEPFRMARHLGARLVAEAAIADGWGDPTGWLRDAEEYFHSADVPAAALACRSLLRRAGATVGHRRQGYEAVPEALRRVGVTTREYEVLVLLLDRLGNKEIAGRLYISPRTVEKHVASLLVKTGQDARPALVAYITTTLGAPH